MIVFDACREDIVALKEKMIEERKVIEAEEAKS